MPVKLRIKRGTNISIYNAQLDTGELVVDQNTGDLFVGTDFGTRLVGKCTIVDSMMFVSMAYHGQLFCDISQNGKLYVFNEDSNDFIPITSDTLPLVLNGDVRGNQMSGGNTINTLIYNKMKINVASSQYGINIIPWFASNTNITLNPNNIMFVPFFINNPTYINQIGLQSRNTTQSTIVIGIYSNTEQSGYGSRPNNLIASFSSINATQTMMYYTNTTSVYLTNGLYWMAYLNQGPNAFSCRGNTNTYAWVGNDGSTIYRCILLASSTLPSISPSYPTLTLTTTFPIAIVYRGYEVS